MISKLKQYNKKLIIAIMLTLDCFGLSTDTNNFFANAEDKVDNTVTTIEYTNSNQGNNGDAISLDTFVDRDGQDIHYNNRVTESSEEKQRRLSVTVDRNSIATNQAIGAEGLGATIGQTQSMKTSIHSIARGNYLVTEKVKGFVNVIRTNTNMGVNVGLTFAF
jgi:hypothetical protein